MIGLLELELKTYDRECARLKREHCGDFVLIQGEAIAGIFDDFETASQYAAERFKGESYLIHCIGAGLMDVPSVLLDGLAAIYTGARGCQ